MDLKNPFVLPAVCPENLPIPLNQFVILASGSIRTGAVIFKTKNSMHFPCDTYLQMIVYEHVRTRVNIHM